MSYDVTAKTCLESRKLHWRLDHYRVKRHGLEGEIEALEEGLEQITSLTLLQSPTFKIYKQFATAFLDQLQYSDTLAVLELSGCSLADGSCVEIAEILNYVKSLRFLNLSSNLIGREGMKFLSLRIPASGLRSLNLQNNPLEDEGVIDLGKAIGDSTRLESVALEGVRFTERGERGLTNGVVRNKILRVLTYNLGETRTNVTKYAPLQEALQQNIINYQETLVAQLTGKETGKWNRSKLLMIGEGRAGKTSTLRRILGKDFDEKEESTVGATITQTQTTTSTEQRWLTLSKADAEYLGQGMSQDAAIGAFLTRSIDAQKEEVKTNNIERRKNRTDVTDKSAQKALLDREGKKRRQLAFQKQLRVIQMEQERARIANEEREREKLRVRMQLSQYVEQYIAHNLVGNRNRRGNDNQHVLLDGNGNALETNLTAFAIKRATQLEVELFTRVELQKIIDEAYRANGLARNRYVANPGTEEEQRRLRQQMQENFTGQQHQDNVDMDVLDVSPIAPTNMSAAGYHIVSTTEKQDAITFSLWDLGGQSLFYSLHHLFLSRFGIYVLCVDLFEVFRRPKICQEYMKFWFHSVKMHASGAPVILVGTHMDMFEGRRELQIINEYFTLPKYFDFKNQFTNVVSLSELFFYPVDNLKDKGVDVLRGDIERVARQQHFVTAEISLKWVFCLEKMMSLRTKLSNGKGASMPDWITIDTVKQVASRVKMTSATEVEQMLDLFHELGVLIRMTGTEELARIVVLNPQWLIDGLCSIIRDKDLHYGEQNMDELKKLGFKEDFDEMYKTGIVSEDLLNYLWRHQDFADSIPFFMDVMKSMVLLSIYSFGDVRVKKFVVPSLLTEKPEENDELKRKNIEEKVISVKSKKILTLEKTTEYCVLDFSKNFLPTGVFERVVCFCVAFSSSVNSAYKVRRPILYSRWAKIHMSQNLLVTLEQKEDQILASVENPKYAPDCLKAIGSILNKLNLELMGAGLKWEISFKTISVGAGISEIVIQNKGKEQLKKIKGKMEVVEREVSEQAAREKGFYPWVVAESQETKKTGLQIDMQDFLGDFLGL